MSAWVSLQISLTSTNEQLEVPTSLAISQLPSLTDLYKLTINDWVFTNSIDNGFSLNLPINKIEAENALKLGTKLDKEQLSKELGLKDHSIAMNVSLCDFHPSITAVQVSQTGSSSIHYEIENFCFGIHEREFDPFSLNTDELSELVRKSLILQCNNLEIDHHALKPEYFSAGMFAIFDETIDVVECVEGKATVANISFSMNVSIIGPFTIGTENNMGLGQISSRKPNPDKFNYDVNYNTFAFTELLQREINHSPAFLENQTALYAYISSCEDVDTLSKINNNITDYLIKVIQAIGPNNNLFKIEKQSTPPTFAVFLKCINSTVVEEFKYALNEIRMSSDISTQSTTYFSPKLVNET